MTTASGLTVWRCCHVTLGAVPLGMSQWSTLWGTPICSRVPSLVPVLLRLQLSGKETEITQWHPWLFSGGTGNTWPHEFQHPGVSDTNRKAFDRGDDWSARNHVLVSAFVGRCPTLQRGLSGWHVLNLRVCIVTISDKISVASYFSPLELSAGGFKNN